MITGPRRRLPASILSTGETIVNTDSRDGLDLMLHAFRQHMNPLRTLIVALGRPWDHLGQVVLVNDPHFDIGKTIFHTITSPIPRLGVKARQANVVYFSDNQLAAIQKLYWERIEKESPSRPAVGQYDAILHFMSTECDFKMEHADGSFSEHLEFCRDYSAIHFRSESPRVLFLHSILGVGTNCWPMSKEKLPQLRELVTEREFQHIEAFPTVLRLMKATPFLDELYTDGLGGREIKGVRFTRALDGAPISMSVEDMWTHLNFHLIHSLDFLPVCGWRANANDVFLQEFASLYILLDQCGERRAHVELPEEFSILRSVEEVRKFSILRKHILCVDDSVCLDIHKSCTRAQSLQGLTQGVLPSLLRALPKSLTKKIVTKQVKEFSQKANVSLEYTWIK